MHICLRLVEKKYIYIYIFHDEPLLLRTDFEKDSMANNFKILLKNSSLKYNIRPNYVRVEIDHK